MQFNKILNLILKNIKEKQVNLQSIYDISKIDPKLWEDWSNKVPKQDFALRIVLHFLHDKS